MCPFCFSSLWAPRLVGGSEVVVTISAYAGTHGKPWVGQNLPFCDLHRAQRFSASYCRANCSSFLRRANLLGYRDEWKSLFRPSI